MVVDNNVSIHTVEQQLEPAIAVAECVDLRAQGKADFNLFTYSPWPHTVATGAGVCSCCGVQMLAGVESEQHKMKRLLAQLAA